MDRKIITITDEGTIIVPNNPSEVRMAIIEIAELLGIYYQTAKRHIQAIEKSGVAEGDYSMMCTCGNLNVRPEYYGLDMIAALAFRVNSWQARKFRQWLIDRVAHPPPEAPTTNLGVHSGERKRTAQLKKVRKICECRKNGVTFVA